MCDILPTRLWRERGRGVGWQLPGPRRYCIEMSRSPWRISRLEVEPRERLSFSTEW